MGVGHQRQPVRSRLAANLYADAGGAVSRRRGRLTIGIGAAVDRVFDHPVDGGVIRSPPGCIAIVLLHRQIEIVLVEPAKRLPRTAQFLNLVEDQPDCVLHPSVRILLVAVAGLDEADRCSHHKFAAACLLVSGR